MTKLIAASTDMHRYAEQATEPAAPAATFGGIYLDDGTNTASTNQEFRFYHNGAYVDFGISITATGATSEIKYKLDATVAPTVSNDNTEGYVVGSLWIDITNDKSYFAVDVTTGAAVWNDLTGASGIGGSTGATDNAIIRADGIGGSTVQSSGITINDSDAIAGATLSASANTIQQGSPVIKTITDPGGAIVAGTDRNLVAAAFSGTADDLIEITGLSVGETVWLVADTGDTITVKHNDAGATVKILLSAAADLILSEDNPLLLYLRATNELAQVLLPTGGIGDHGARVYHNANQSILNVTPTTLAFNSERWDTDAYHDPVTDNSKLTIPAGQDGKYIISTTLGFAANSTGIRDIQILVNGATIIDRLIINATAAGTIQLSVTTIANLVATDYVEVLVQHDGGVALNVESIAEYSPEFMLQRLA
jgi:hypothetical protein